MSNFLIDVAGHAAGLSQAQIDKLEADAPGVAALVHAVREAAPLIAQVQAIYEKAKPLVAQALAELPTLDDDAQIILGVLAKGKGIMSFANQEQDVVRFPLHLWWRDDVPKLCQLPTPGQSGIPVYVNPLTVSYIRPGTGNTCIIYFADNHSVGVAVTADEAKRQLDVALNADQL